MVTMTGEMPKLLPCQDGWQDLPMNEEELTKNQKSALEACSFDTLIRFAIIAHERQVSTLRFEATASVNGLSSDVFGNKRGGGPSPPKGVPDPGGGGLESEQSLGYSELQNSKPTVIITPPADMGAQWVDEQHPTGSKEATTHRTEDDEELMREKQVRLAAALQASEDEDEEMEETGTIQRLKNAGKRSKSTLKTMTTHPLEFLRNAEKGPVSAMENFLEGRFDRVMNLLVIASALCLFMELELRGLDLDAMLKGEPTSESTAVAKDVFNVVEHVINALFLAEIIFRIHVYKFSFFYDRFLRKIKTFNCLDVTIVITCSFDLYLLPVIYSGNKEGSSFGTLRLLRLLRLTRALRVLRVMAAFSKLRILLNTTASSFMSLFWAMVLVFLLIYGSALFLCQVLQTSIEDEGLPLDLREWIFRYYGSGSKSVWTLFEITFSGGWPNYARRLIEEVHWFYFAFFATYVWVVVFAVTRIITALFLKDTMQIANEDQEMMVREQQATKQKYMKKLGDLFKMTDVSGDGQISLHELQAVVQEPKVKLYFSMLDLQIEEVCELFTMLDDGNGAISYEEFCKGVMRLKGQARAMDVISTMRDCREILNKIEQVRRLCLDEDKRTLS